MPTPTTYYGTFHLPRPADRSLRILLGASLLAHLALVMLLLLLPGGPAGQGEMSVELGTLMMPPQKIAVPAAPPVQIIPKQLAPQPTARPVPVNAGGQRDVAGPVPVPSSFAPGFLPAPGTSSRGTGAPAPLPFPEQQRRITIPYSTYSSSRRAAA